MFGIEGIEPVKFGSGVLGVEAPVDDCLGGVTLPHQGLTSRSRVSSSGIRCFRQHRDSTLNSISAIPSTSSGQDSTNCRASGCSEAPAVWQSAGPGPWGGLRPRDGYSPVGEGVGPAPSTVRRIPGRSRWWGWSGWPGQRGVVGAVWILLISSFPKFSRSSATFPIHYSCGFHPSRMPTLSKWSSVPPRLCPFKFGPQGHCGSLPAEEFLRTNRQIKIEMASGYRSSIVAKGGDGEGALGLAEEEQKTIEAVSFLPPLSP